ncbi:unnamed protein product [Phytophthora fragariaefolia]|uniref:Unnamed protein product n=1 Tax=Phytophthora fragariaefolia TaxID=1490495 RepID=A0A9W6YBP4_9STRA|nr:unnamed protein product [Phytophthora fragariaefolia]
MCVVSGAEAMVTVPVSAQRQCTRPRADVTILGIATGSQKKLRQPAGAGPPADDAVERVDIGHAVSKAATPSESHSHCKKKDDKPNLVILKVNSKREISLRALVDCGALNNFVGLQSVLRRVKLPRSLLEVRVATGAVVRTGRRARMSSLSTLRWKRFARHLQDGRIEPICILSDVERMESEAEELKQLVTDGADALIPKSKKEHFDDQSWDSIKSSPLYEVLREYKDVLPDASPAELPQDKGVQHEIDLVPGTKYCGTR